MYNWQGSHVPCIMVPQLHSNTLQGHGIYPVTAAINLICRITKKKVLCLQTSNNIWLPVKKKESLTQPI